MYLAHYAFDGEPAELEAAYEKLLADFPPDSFDLHLVVRRPDGLDVYDACPNAETFAAFSTSAEFQAAVTRAGLPLPRSEGLGEVVNVLFKRPAP